MWGAVIDFVVLVVRSIGNIRKIWRLTVWETEMSQQAKQLDDEKRELQELAEIKEQNIKNIRNLITVRVDDINFLLNSPQPAVEVQFLVENRSIFELRMVKFLSTRVFYNWGEIGGFPADVRERRIGRQSGLGLQVRLPLATTLENELRKKQQDREPTNWQFTVQAYFTWDFEPFDIEQTVSTTR